MNFYIPAYITGTLIVIIGLLIFVFPSRKTNLIFKLSVDIVAVLNGLFIYFATKEPLMFAGIASTAIGACRDVVFLLRKKCKIFNSYVWPIGFASLFALSLIITYKSPISLFPVIGSVISTLTLYLYSRKHIKGGAIFCQGLYIVYYALLLEGSDILTIFSLCSSITGFTGAFVGLCILLFKNDKPFDDNAIKFSFWNYLYCGQVNKKIVKQWKEMGINLPMSFVYDESNPLCKKEDMIALLDECQKYNIKCIISDTRTSFKTYQKEGLNEFIKNVQRAKEDFASHPATYGFFVGDEPNLNEHDDYIASLSIVNKEMPALHHYGNLLPYFSDLKEQEKLGRSKEWLMQYVRNIIQKSNSSILGFDAYTQCNVDNKEKGIMMFQSNLEHYQTIANEYKVPLFTSILSIGHLTYRVPNQDDIRWQINVPIAMGSRGIVFFYFHQKLDDPGFKVETAPFKGEKATKTFMYYYIEKAIRRFQKRANILNSSIIDSYSFTCDDESLKFTEKKNLPYIISKAHSLKGEKHYIAITNYSQRETNSYTVVISGKKKKFSLFPGEMRIFQLNK